MVSAVPGVILKNYVNEILKGDIQLCRALGAVFSISPSEAKGACPAGFHDDKI